MRADYDSWRDEIDAGEGYALGGHGTFRPVRVRQRWRAAIAQQLRLVILDMAVVLLCVLAVFLTAVLRSVAMLAVAAILCLFAGLWFRHQRMAHERRPR